MTGTGSQDFAGEFCLPKGLGSGLWIICCSVPLFCSTNAVPLEKKPRRNKSED
jgi:hypothetical protein